MVGRFSEYEKFGLKPLNDAKIRFYESECAYPKGEASDLHKGLFLAAFRVFS